MKIDHLLSKNTFLNFLGELQPVLSIKVGRRCFGTQSVDIDGVIAWKWNYERVIDFQSVILQHAQGVINAKYICVFILF